MTQGSGCGALRVTGKGPDARHRPAGVKARSHALLCVFLGLVTDCKQNVFRKQIPLIKLFLCFLYNLNFALSMTLQFCTGGP